MWIPVVLVFAVLVTFWQVTLLLTIWAFVLFCWWAFRHTVQAPKRRPDREFLSPPPGRMRPPAGQVRARPQPRPQTPPTAGFRTGRELPPPDYLPRWTPHRRRAEALAQAQWQNAFER